MTVVNALLCRIWLLLGPTQMSSDITLLASWCFFQWHTVVNAPHLVRAPLCRRCKCCFNGYSDDLKMSSLQMYWHDCVSKMLMRCAVIECE